MARVYLLPFLLLLYSQVSAQNIDSLKCNTQCVAELQENLNQTNHDQVFTFLASFSIDCKNNAEYSQFSNEVLFELIQKKPELFAEVLEQNQNKFDIDAIILTLKNPIHDLIDLDETKKQLSLSNLNQELKNKLIQVIP